ncbi:molybdopterin-binding protein [Sulfuricurvum sp.]|uniref:TOBE domain-containing protein n=1 Tax=Sulfuricurvum sp. TaxID=2025608 RepID=UPI00286DC7D5|nr:TOBE domain-containing protein [Sulfuricurvum sp.]
MLTSARNTLYGTVDSVVTGAVNSELVLSLGNEKIVATLTNESVKHLEIAIGSSAYALIKSSSIILAKTKPLRISARNVLPATVSDVIKGAVNSEIKMTIGNTTLTSIITNESCEELMMKKGDDVYAIFKASSVIIGML